jgi:hypothetical protein
VERACAGLGADCGEEGVEGDGVGLEAVATHVVEGRGVDDRLRLGEDGGVATERREETAAQTDAWPRRLSKARRRPRLGPATTRWSGGPALDGRTWRRLGWGVAAHRRRLLR